LLSGGFRHVIGGERGMAWGRVKAPGALDGEPLLREGERNSPRKEVEPGAWVKPLLIWDCDSVDGGGSPVLWEYRLQKGLVTVM
jgi:hypothetical protein